MTDTNDLDRFLDQRVGRRLVHRASNWDNGVPTPTSTADLDLSGTYTVTSSASVTVNELISISTATLDIIGGTFTVTNFAGQGPLILSGGTLDIGSSTNGLTVNFSGSGGTLQLDNTVTGGTAAGVDATSTGTAPMTITGAAAVTSTGADGIDATSAGGDITITPAGSVTGAGTGIDATQNGNGNVTISVGPSVAITGSGLYGVGAFSFGSGDLSVSTATGDTVDSETGSAGIVAVNKATTIGQLADGSITVTASGTIDPGANETAGGSRPAGILAGYEGGTTDTPTSGVFGDVTVTNDANITAAGGDGIRAFDYGVGNVTVTDEDNTTIQTTGTNGQFGIQALSEGLDSTSAADNISVTTSVGDTIKSAGSGINAVNLSTEVASAANSSITVSANGTIDSGTTANPDNTRPAGILAGYNPGDSGTPSDAVFGNVTVTNDANITADAGEGIRVFNYGTANETVTDEPNTTIIALGQPILGQTNPTDGYGIYLFSDGVGNVSVTTSAGDTINAAGAGIVAQNDDPALLPGQSSVTVTAYGTINSGPNLTAGGNTPAGILAGFFPTESGPEQGDTGATGTVTINNFANISAAAGPGIEAYNWDNGDVIVNDNYGAGAVASTTVSGTVFGIEAEALSGGSGNVTVNVGTNAAISTSNASTAFFGIYAFSLDTGNITVSTSPGDVVTSASDGVVAVNEASTILPSANSSITVTAAGTINSGPNLDGNGNPPAGIVASYYPNNSGTPDSNVAGNISVTSDATIDAAAGSGILATNYGTGSVIVTTAAGSSITAPAYGIYASASVDGTVTVDNFGNIIASTGTGIGAYNYGNGDVTVDDNYGPGAVTSTTISGAQYGIEAAAESGGTGDVTVNIGANATISTSTGSNGLFGIQAFSLDAGNITVSMSAGDVVTSGSNGVTAASLAATEPADSTITVTADGTINSGPNTQDGGYPSGGIQAGYFPNNSATPDANVQGSVSVTSDATITAAGGWGINAFNWGTGNATVTTEAGSSITNNGSSITTSAGTFAAVGIGAYAFDGGDASTSNAATVTAATGIGLQAQATTPGGDGSGIVTITNSGDVFGDGTAYPVVQITTDSTGAATLTNDATGEIAPASLSTAGQAIFDPNDVTIDNSGTIIGNVALSSTTFSNNTAFTNESTGVWDVSGSNGFGSGIDTIDNKGLIDVGADVPDVVNSPADSSTSFWANGTLTFENEGAGLVTINGATLISGAVTITATGTSEFAPSVISINASSSGAAAVVIGGSATGTGLFDIPGGGMLEFSGTDTVPATFDGLIGTLKLDNATPTSFTGNIDGLVLGDTIDLANITPSSITSAVINASGSTLTVTETNGTTLTYNIAAAGGSFSSEYFSLQSDGASGTDLVLSAALAPTITVTTAAHTTTADAAVAPFVGVTIADTNSGATDTLTITLSDSGATGTLSGSGLSGGTAGVYTLAGSAATITADLDALSFQPATGSADSNTTTTFTLSDLSSAGTSASNNSITVTDTNEDVWINASGGDWSTASNWDNGVPTSTTTAELNASGTYTVTSSASVTVNELISISTATLDIIGGTFTVTDFAGQGPLILSGGTLDIGSSTNGLMVNFSGSGGTLQLNNTVTGGTASRGRCDLDRHRRP